MATQLPECNVIMKGGITSGVVYPKALAEFAQTYRLRSLGGASAGAIGAAFGAAAEHGRQRGYDSFTQLTTIPDALSDGKLARLFQPQPPTRALLPVLMSATGHDKVGEGTHGLGRFLSVTGALVRGFPLAALLGALLGFVAAVLGVVFGGAIWGLVLVLGLVVALVGAAAGLVWAAFRTLTRAVPANAFGICSGLSTDPVNNPAFTDWLADWLDRLAGRDPAGPPLVYGQLWTGSDAVRAVDVADREVDLRMVSTCLTQGRPYEMPWEARGFFFDPAAWRRLFPKRVVDALEAAPPASPPDPADAADWAAEDAAAARHQPPLRRLPDPEHLPVIVSVRLSLSFPLLISAIPLWTIDRRERGPAPAFVMLWFTDGGFCSNFPLHLFDAALPTRPTFAINLGAFEPGRPPAPNPEDNIRYARSNRSGILPSHRPLAPSGLSALTGFLGAALGTSREWSDAAHLATPGSRDRIVRVLQSPTEGGLNLFMDGPTIETLADRGQAAAAALVDMFTEKRYGGGTATPHTATGWDNHRWVRYRALMAALPVWHRSFAAGHAALSGVDPADPPSYDLTVRGRVLAADLASNLLAAAALVDDPARQAAVADLTAGPNPRTVIRRVPTM